MIYSTVIDPSLFDPVRLNDSDLATNVFRFAQALVENLVVHVDKNGKLEKAIIANGARLAELPKKGPLISALIAELVKQRRRKFRPFMCSDRFVGDQLHVQLSIVSKADAYVTFQGAAPCGCKVVEIGGYLASELEAERSRAARGYHDVDKREVRWLSEQIYRTCRNSNRLVIVEKQLMKANRRKAFFEGISFFLQSALHGASKALPSVSVDLITAAQFDEAKPSEWQQRDLDTAAASLAKELKIALKRDLPTDRPALNVTVKFKKDDLGRRLLHDRYWMSDFSVIKLTRGFDFFADDRKLFNQSLVLADSAEPIVEEIRMLPDGAKTQAFSV
jgi:hypothetical protein